VRRVGLHKIDELITELDECVAGAFPSQPEIEDLAVEFERFVDIADFECNVVDADEPRFAPVDLAGVGHRICPSWPVGLVPSI
jgi:hypothetical protein